MGILSMFSLGGGQADEKMAAQLANMIIVSDAMLNIKPMLSDPRKKKVVAGFLLGFADFSGQMKKLSPDAILNTARSMMKTAFCLSDAEATAIMETAKECSRTPEGRRYMQAGAESLARFMAKQSGTPMGTSFLGLVAEAK